MICGVKTKSVSHFHAGDGWKTNRAIRIWLACFAEYSGMFDECTVVVASDRPDDRYFNNEVVTEITKHCFCKNVEIKIVENTCYRESKTFYDEIVQKRFDGLTFFNHTKGETNYAEHDKDSIDDWIIGAWFLSLMDMENTVPVLLHAGSKNAGSFFYGSFSMINEDGSIPADLCYHGTFYWTNMEWIRNEIGSGLKCEIPALSSRLYAEKFPGYILSHWPPVSGSNGSHLLKGFRSFNFYLPLDMYSDNSAYWCIHILAERYGSWVLEGFNKLKEKVNNELAKHEISN